MLRPNFLRGFASPPPYHEDHDRDTREDEDEEEQEPPSRLPHDRRELHLDRHGAEPPPCGYVVGCAAQGERGSLDPLRPAPLGVVARELGQVGARVQDHVVEPLFHLEARELDSAALHPLQCDRPREVGVVRIGMGAPDVARPRLDIGFSGVQEGEGDEAYHNAGDDQHQPAGVRGRDFLPHHRLSTSNTVTVPRMPSHACGPAVYPPKSMYTWSGHAATAKVLGTSTFARAIAEYRARGVLVAST
ncbi:MAG: hypothetical protein RBG13Loki_0308 [Promethearchaeota archaeon CR_4]|nr:MAG: hypothetical protein RBG13Loki_0308 [Candidatus Lokiarchaeota archaeon CR_4]